MKKFIYLFILGLGFTSCSVESMDSTENLLTADAKFKIQEVAKSMTLLESEICEGEAPSFVVNFPQNENGQGKTDVKIQIETFPGSGEWGSFMDVTYFDAGPKTITYTDEVLVTGNYSFRVSIGSGGFDYTATLNVVECSDCEESFNYTANLDGSYTFTYVPEEDMENALLIFTLAQSDTDTGLEGWEDKGATKQKTMDLVACEVYEWIVTLTPHCPGETKSNKAWTDFKVNGVSKKNNATPNIEKGC